MEVYEMNEETAFLLSLIMISGIGYWCGYQLSWQIMLVLVGLALPLLRWSYRNNFRGFAGQLAFLVVFYLAGIIIGGGWYLRDHTKPEFWVPIKQFVFK
jgi:uncharacterized membrane protein YqjE